MLTVVTSHGAAPSAPATAEAIEEQEAGFDRTVWRDEVLAGVYEKTIVRLADELRRAEDREAVLARLEFDQIAIPRTKGKAMPLGLGMQRQEFDPAQSVVLPHPAWQRALRQFQQAGWRILQTEWRHERFEPPTSDHPAVSSVGFEIHGEQAAQTNRFIIRGRLRVQWAAGTEGAPEPRMANLAVEQVELVERSGPPGLDNHALIAPEPARPDGQVNLHPLAVIDLNQDGHDDIIMAGVNKVLVNDGQARFQTESLIEETNFVGLREAGVIADFNGDGRLDFLGVPASGVLSNYVVLYPGGGSVPLTSAPVAAWTEQRLSAVSAITAGDVDRDGDLDVWLAQYKPPYVGGQLPTPYYDANDGYPSYLLLNDGTGRFQQATAQAGLHRHRFRRTLAASLADLDQDGDMDLVTLNDFSGIDLYRNDGHGKFEDVSEGLGNRHLFGMGHCIADFDRDGMLDLFGIGMSITTVRRMEAMRWGRQDRPEATGRRADMAFGNRLFLRREQGWTQPDFGVPLARTGWSWGASAFDLDNDGDIEVYVANGHVSGASAEDYCSHYWRHDIYLGSSREDPQLQRYLAGQLNGLNAGRTSWNGYQHNALFIDIGTNHYEEAAFLMGVAHEADSRAVISADLNEDGRMDLLVTVAQWVRGPNIMRHRLLVHLNRLATGNHWLGVRFKTGPRKPSPIGALIEARTADRRYSAQIVTGDSFQSQHPWVVHFGLGRETKVQEVKIRWPSGEVRTIQDPAADRYLVVEGP